MLSLLYLDPALLALHFLLNYVDLSDVAQTIGINLSTGRSHSLFVTVVWRLLCGGRGQSVWGISLDLAGSLWQLEHLSKYANSGGSFDAECALYCASGSSRFGDYWQ